MNSIDILIDELRAYTVNFPFIEYYSHTNCDMYKILNEHTQYEQDKWVLHPVSEGFEKSLDAAIKAFIKHSKQCKVKIKE